MAKPVCPECKKSDKVVKETVRQNGEVIYKWLACNRCDEVFRTLYCRQEIVQGLFEGHVEPDEIYND